MLDYFLLLLDVVILAFNDHILKKRVFILYFVIYVEYISQKGRTTIYFFTTV